MKAPAADADVELVLIAGKETGPLARIRIGNGSALFASGGSVTERTAKARRRFETLSPAAGRTRVLARLRKNWPNLVEKPAPIQTVLDAWVASGQPDETAAQFKPQLTKVAAQWSTQPHYFAMLSTSRELDKAIDAIEPGDTPVAVDVAYTQMRDARGAMRHVIAIVLATP